MTDAFLECLVCIKPGTQIKLFIFPGAGGGALSLEPLASLIDEEIAVYGFEPPNLVDYSLRIKDMASLAMQAMKSIQPAGPYFLAGYSFGGIVAFETATILEKLGDQIAYLGLLDTYPPGPRKEISPANRIQVHYQNIRGLSFKATLGYFQKRFWRFVSQLPRRRIFRKLFAAQIPVLENIASHDVLGAARASTILFKPDVFHGKVNLFVAEERPWYVTWDVLNEWNKFIVGEIERVHIPADHFSMMNTPTEIADGINHQIKKLIPK